MQDICDMNTVSDPDGTVPLIRAERYLCTELDSTSALNGTAPLIRAGRYP